MIEYLHVTLIALAAAAALTVGWFMVSKTAGRVQKVVLAAVMAGMVATTGLLAERLLGNARPVEWELVKSMDAEVLYARMMTGDAIYLLLADQPPVYYRLDWTEELAKELREAMREAEEKEGKLMFRFEPSLDDRERKFYALPQPKLPDKPPQPEAPDYNAPGWDI